MAGVAPLISLLPSSCARSKRCSTHARQLGDARSGDETRAISSRRFAMRSNASSIRRRARSICATRRRRAPTIRALAAPLNRNLTSGFIAVDAAGAVVAINDAGREILGRAAGSGWPAAVALPRRFAAIVRASLASRTRRTRREIVLDESAVADRHDHRAAVRTSRRVPRLFALFTDLTTIRAMEERVRDLRRLVGLGADFRRHRPRVPQLALHDPRLPSARAAIRDRRNPPTNRQRGEPRRSGSRAQSTRC